MNSLQLVNLYNAAPVGNYIRKLVIRDIASEEYILLIEHLGYIWPKKLAQNKKLSYTISSRQLLIRNESDAIIEKIILGNIQRIDAEQKLESRSVMRLTIEK